MQTAAEMHKTGYSPSESNGQSTKKRHEMLRKEKSSTNKATTRRKQKQPPTKYNFSFHFDVGMSADGYGTILQ
jgi:hypothetical protein